jgi:hypothetical protein
MDIRSGCTIPAFRRHVTILLWICEALVECIKQAVYTYLCVHSWEMDLRRVQGECEYVRCGHAPH